MIALQKVALRSFSDLLLQALQLGLEVHFSNRSSSAEMHLRNPDLQINCIKTEKELPLQAAPVWCIFALNVQLK